MAVVVYALALWLGLYLLRLGSRDADPATADLLTLDEATFTKHTRRALGYRNTANPSANAF